jgi:hypothetical protein
VNLAGTVPAGPETNQPAGAAAAQARRIARSFRSDRLKQHESAPEPLPVSGWHNRHRDEPSPSPRVARCGNQFEIANPPASRDTWSLALMMSVVSSAIDLNHQATRLEIVRSRVAAR